MNKKQWLVLGIGLIIMSFYFSYISTIADCSKIQDDYVNNINEALAQNKDVEVIQNYLSSMDAWVISCFDKNQDISSISSISFTLGIIFVILGFLEPKK